MKVKQWLVLVALVTLLTPAFAQDFGLLGSDLKTVFTGIGRDITPRLHQMALSGNDLVGEARLRGLTRFYVSVAGVNLTTMDGLGSVLTSPDTVWKFDLVSIPNIIQSALGEADDISDYFNLATAQAMALPSLRLGLGFPLPFGLELLANGMYVPAVLVDMGLGLAGDVIPASLKEGITFGMLTAGGILRKPILSDKRGLLRPSLSLGLSYTYSTFQLELDNFNLGALLASDDPDVKSPLNIEGLGNLNMTGEVGFTTTTHTIGAIVHISKTLLWTLTPFAKFGAYYHFSDYESVLQVEATLRDDNGDDLITPATLDASTGIIRIADVSFIVSGGLEVKLLPITLTTSLSLDLERPVVGIPPIADLMALKFTDLYLNGLSITVALRLQI
jgi:hypothetical protein